MAKVTVTNKKRIAFVFFVFMILLIILSFRMAWIQIVKAEEYTEIATDQQTSDIPIEAKRGAILDRNGKELATSATCYTLWVRPSQLRENNTEDEIQKLSEDLSKILDASKKTIK